MNHHDAEFKQYFFPPAIIDGVFNVKLNSGEPFTIVCSAIKQLHVATDCCGGDLECWVELLDGRTYRLMHPPADVKELFDAWTRDEKARR